uniref:NADH dehydrogenase [ubiquinone] 1 subunit C1, mitochondrial n=1 Tax=Monodon monoceros TaxID=40151 RepID=A0A8C6AE72_MONMO
AQSWFNCLSNRKRDCVLPEAKAVAPWPQGQEEGGAARLLAPARILNGFLARSKFYIWELPDDKPDWLKAGLALGTSIFLWIYLIKHNEDVLEYKRRNGLE